MDDNPLEPLVQMRTIPCLVCQCAAATLFPDKDEAELGEVLYCEVCERRYPAALLKAVTD